MKLSRLNHKGLNAVVYNEIKKWIISSDLQPGERLSVHKVSEQLGVSRTPVSNAFRLLEKDGYLTVHSRSGTYIREFTKEEISLIYDFREAIEKLTVRVIAGKVSKQRLAAYKKQFERLLKNCEQCTEIVVRDLFNIEMDFHEYLTGCCPEIIRPKIENLIDLSKRCRYVNIEKMIRDKSKKSYCAQAIRVHLDLIQALLDGDLDKAEDCIVRDIKRAKEDSLQNYRNQEHSAGGLGNHRKNKTLTAKDNQRMVFNKK